MYVRLPYLLAELDLATVQENYRKRINQYIKCNLFNTGREAVDRD